MRFSIALIFILCQLCIVAYAQKSKKFFRNDYRYFESTKSFYKIHTFAKTWKEAKEICELEGSTFYYPEDENEAHVVAGYMRNRTKSSIKAFVGASARLVQGVYETLNGEYVSNLYDNWAPDEPNGRHSQNCVTFHRDGTMYDENCDSKYPFICKKTLSSLEWDRRCNMPDLGYEYSPATGRCYKFHSEPKVWNDAYASCEAEMSYLAVIDNRLEANVLVNLTRRRKDDSVQHRHDLVQLGFHNIFDKGWTTIKGVPIKDSGYSTWMYGQPDFQNNNEYCGCMDYFGGLGDLPCYVLPTFFICEHEIKSMTNGGLESVEYNNDI